MSIRPALRYPVRPADAETVHDALCHAALSGHPDATGVLREILLHAIRSLSPQERHALLLRFKHLSDDLAHASLGVPGHVWIHTAYGIFCEGCQFAVSPDEPRANAHFRAGPCTGRFEDTLQQLQQTPSRRS